MGRLGGARPLSAPPFLRHCFWWRNILKLLDKYKGLASVDAGDGLSCML